jgi:pimeloyl-ACP methyl ester carboxylesterase
MTSALQQEYKISMPQRILDLCLNITLLYTMATYTAVSLLLLGAASAAAIPPYKHPHGLCHHFDVAITAEATGAVYDIPQVVDDITTVQWAVHADTWSWKLRPDHGIMENITIGGTYNIHAQLCVPTGPARKRNVLQIATHGGHYDGRYWDSEYKPEEHSYVYASLAAGYSILTYDRLGAGKSDIPDAYNGVQTAVELDILRQLTKKARDGSLIPPHSWTDAGSEVPPKPAKIVHVGHSFGSVVTTAFLATYPEETDGGIITGFALNKYFGSTGFSSWYAQYAATAGWDRGSGYVVNQKPGIQVVFFGGDPATAFTKELLDYGDSIKQPVPVGELASGAQIIGRPGTGLKAPIQFVLPEFDFFVCGGDCKGLTNVTTLREIWPAASDLDLVIQPNTGHALPFHNNATAGFRLSFDFLARNGL